MSMPSLTEIATKHKTDKWGSHFYIPHYERHLEHLRNNKIKLLEIGVGGYEDPKTGGHGMRMWKEFFPNGQIYAIDIFNKQFLKEDRIKIFQGSQVDEKFLKEIVNEASSFDVIIDDGSHINSHVIKTFEILFPFLSPNGLYIVEDLQTSYWKEFGGDSFNLKKRTTAMNYFKQLTDRLNYQEFDNPFYKPNYFDKNIVSICFYHNMVFIQKGENVEKTNWVFQFQRTYKTRRVKLKYFLRFLLSRIAALWA